MAVKGLFNFETLQELHTGWVVFGMLGLAFWSSLVRLPMIAILMYIGLAYFGKEAKSGESMFIMEVCFTYMEGLRTITIQAEDGKFIYRSGGG